MQENNFERQVQLKMEELKLYPQEHVWEYIYANIKKEKRRRWLLVFFLIFLAGILYGGFLLLSPKISTNTVKQIQAPNIPGNNNLKQSPVYAKPDSIQNTSATTQITSLKNDRSISQANEKQHTTAILLPGQIENKEKKSSRNSSENISQGITEKENNDSLSPVTKETNAQAAAPEEKKATGLQNISGTPISTSGDTSGSPVTDSTKKDEVIKTIPTATSGKKSKTKNRWKWGISLSGGISTVSEKFLGSSSQNQGIVALSSGYISGFTSSEIKPSFAATAGIFTEKNISPTAQIAIGLNYKLFSTTNKVGADSAAYFQSRNAQNTYHNYYHFIELPVTIYIQLNKKIPLFWNAGVSISELLSSNALQFNGATGLYYHDNSVFNKTQVGLSTGIEIQLAKQKRQIFIGPSLHYNITKFSNTGIYLGEHFNFIGLHLRVIPGKK